MNHPTETPNNDSPSPNKSDSHDNTLPIIIYTLYLANFVIPFTSLIGVILAYINKNDDTSFLQSHYQFQIRTFWIGLLYFFVGALLTLILVGWLILLFYAVWLIIRCVKGLRYLINQQPIPNPTSWMFS